MNVPRPTHIEDKNPQFTKEMRGPFNGQGKFLNELPTIIQLLRWNLRELQDESKRWDVAEWGPFGNRLEEWMTSHDFIKYKSKYREAEGALSNLQNELLKGRGSQKEINNATQLLIDAIIMGVPPGGTHYGDEGLGNQYILSLLPQSISYYIVVERDRLWRTRGWVEDPALIDSDSESNIAGKNKKSRKKKKYTKKKISYVCYGGVGAKKVQPILVKNL
jgi:hypothetical protein